jgi:HlyD family secretion protein
MSSLMNSAPMPDPGREPIAPQPKPSIVPPREPGKRGPARWAIPLAVIVIGAGLAFYLKSQAAIKTGGGGPGITVPTASVIVGDINRTIRVTGTVAAQNFQTLLAPRIQGSRSNTNRGGMGGGLTGVSGGGGGGGGMGGGMGGPGGDFALVLLRLAKAGTHVKQGDPVGQFDPTNQLQRLDDYKDTVIQNDNQIKKMMASLAATKEAHDQTVRAAKASWEQAQLDLQTTPVKSAIDAENLKLSAEQAQAKYKQLVEEDAWVMESQRATIRVSELNRSQSSIELQRSENNVKRMEIHSPMDGIVVMASIVRNGEYGQVREGDQVNAGQPFVTIVDPRSMILNATVNQVDAERLRLGMKASVHLDAYPDVDLPATLDGIGAMSKTSTFRAGYVGEIPIRIKIDKMDSRVIPDLTGSAEIVLNSEKSTMVLPRSAVFEENGEAYVFVQSPQGWIKRKVEPGITSYTNIAIHSGLQKGDVVALQRPI